MKDVTSCDKPRLGAFIRRPVDFRMSELDGSHCPSPHAEHIGMVEVTRRTETSKYPEEEKSTEIPLVVASERGPRPNR